jgi:hypothetical protein
VDEKRRWALRSGTVPLTRTQWIVVAVVLLIAVICIPLFIILGHAVWAAGVGSVGGLILVGVQLAAIGARNDRIGRGQ